MSIRRTRLPFEDGHNFTKVPNDWIRDRRLTRKARLLLIEILSHRVGWEVTTEALIGAGKERRDAVLSGIAELKDLGYLVEEKKRRSGRFDGVDYVLSMPHELPERTGLSRLTASGKSGHGAPVDKSSAVTGKSDAAAPDYPDTENPQLKKTNSQEDQEEHIQSSAPAHVGSGPASEQTTDSDSEGVNNQPKQTLVGRMLGRPPRKLDLVHLEQFVKPWFTEIVEEYPSRWADVLDDLAGDILRKGRFSVISDENAYVARAISNDLELYRAAMWQRLGVSRYADR